MPSDARPFFGIGARRAGNAWLSKVLNSHPDCKMTTLECAHLFDRRRGESRGPEYYRSKTMELSSLGKQAAEQMFATLDRIKSGSRGLRSSGADYDDGIQTFGRGWNDDVRSRFFAEARLDELGPKINDIVATLLLRDVDAYADWVKRKAAGASAFGQILPACALFPAASFAEMDRALPGSHFLFIMRDPVERLWSYARSQISQAGGRGQKPMDPEIAFERALLDSEPAAQSNYHRTVGELESAIPADRILYFFYETMTSPEAGPAEIRRLEDGLGLARTGFSTDLFTRPINASPPAKLSRERETVALEFFQPVYEFVERRFGRQPRWRQWRTA